MSSGRHINHCEYLVVENLAQFIIPSYKWQIGAKTNAFINALGNNWWKACTIFNTWCLTVNVACCKSFIKFHSNLFNPRVSFVWYKFKHRMYILQWITFALVLHLYLLKCSLALNHRYLIQVQIEKKGKKIKVVRRYFIKWKFFCLDQF